MSDLSAPPLSLLPLEGERPPAEPARFCWPTPSLPCYPAPEPGAGLEDCVIEALNGKTLCGRLVQFNPSAGAAQVLVPASRTPLPLRFNQFRCLRLNRSVAPLPFDPTETTPLALTDRRAQPYVVHLAGGVAMQGRTITHEETADGLFLFEPVDDHGTVRRCFVPRAAYSHVDIGPLLGEVLVAQRSATPQQVDEALGEQHKLRNQKIGELLLDRQLISREELEAAIEEQSRMPMVRIGQALIALGFISDTQLDQALEQQQRDRGVPLGELLLRKGVITVRELQTAMARKMGYPLVDPLHFAAESDALQKLPYALAAKVQALPLMMRGGRLVVALEDPTQRKLIDEIEFAAGTKVIPVLTRANTVGPAIDRWYEKFGLVSGMRADSAQGIDFVPDEAEKLLATLELEGGESEREDDTVAQSDNSLVRLINTMVLDAQSQGASDIHIECPPGREKVRIRFRRDGVLRPYLELPGANRNALIARIKIMCELDISERRKPQDGKIAFGRFVTGQKLELRVATIPTHNGCEDAVLRLLASAKPLPMDKLGLSTSNFQRLAFASGRPYGLILCVGPTGSGKTTTLHSVLGHINTPERKIWTAEDPIEITQSGLRQVQVNPRIELTFARALRAFLRADPDVIMVGEIRDQETADIAVEASLTGHLVMSTLHTNSAAETVTRLLDMGLDPFNFGDALLAVLAQRLVRRLCPECRTTRDARPEEIDELLADHCGASRAVEGAPDAGQVLDGWRRRFGVDGRLRLVDPAGCGRCDQSGWRGRIGVHELLAMSPALRKLIQTGARAEEICRVAQAEGMHTLRQDGIDKVWQGQTTIAEVRSTTNG